MKNFYFIIGGPGTGKTTFIKHMTETNQDNKALFIGQELRKKYGEKFFLEQKDPGCPEATDNEVLSMLNSFIFDTADGCTGYVDGFPRKLKQMDYLMTLSGHNMDDVFNLVIFLSDFTYNIKGESEDSAKLRESRIEKDRNNINEMILDMFYNGWPRCINVIPICITKNMQLAELEQAVLRPNLLFTKNNMSYLFNRHRKLESEYSKRFGISVDESYQALKEGDFGNGKHGTACIFLEGMVTRMKEEVEELYNEVHDSFWGNKNVDLRKVRVEIVDILHFLFTISMTAGMGPLDLNRIYLEKNTVNRNRMFVGKKKGDDDHVGEI